MLAQILLVAGILLLVFAGYKAVTVVKALRRMQQRQSGFFNVSCAGDCGSAFDFILQIQDGRISHAATRGGRCAHSLICAKAAADLAKGKTPEQVKKLTPHEIAQKAGGLSAEHMHCAILAAHGMAQTIKALEAQDDAAASNA